MPKRRPDPTIQASRMIRAATGTCRTTGEDLLSDDPETLRLYREAKAKELERKKGPKRP